MAGLNFNKLMKWLGIPGAIVACLIALEMFGLDLLRYRVALAYEVNSISSKVDDLQLNYFIDQHLKLAAFIEQMRSEGKSIPDELLKRLRHLEMQIKALEEKKYKA